MILPFLLSNPRPNTRKKVDILQRRVSRRVIRQNLRNRLYKLKEFLLSACDYVGQNITIYNSKGKLKFFNENSYSIDLIFIVITKSANKFIEHRFNVYSFIVVIVLDVY